LGSNSNDTNLDAMGFTLSLWAGFKDMSPPIKELMKLTLEGKLAHGGHPVLRWMMDNIFVRTDLLEMLNQTKKDPLKK